MAGIKDEKRSHRHRRVRAKISGTPQVPRLFVFKSNKNTYAGLADDTTGKTLLFASNTRSKDNTIDSAKKVGEDLAAKALKIGVKRVVFDRSGYRYHGKVR